MDDTSCRISPGFARGRECARNRRCKVRSGRTLMNHGVRERGSAVPSVELWSKDRAETLLSQGYWFRDLAQDFRRALIERSELRTFKRNEWLFRIGDPV